MKTTIAIEEIVVSSINTALKVKKHPDNLESGNIIFVNFSEFENGKTIVLEVFAGKNDSWVELSLMDKYNHNLLQNIQTTNFIGEHKINYGGKEYVLIVESEQNAKII